jgi:hypothetical protein
MSSPRSVTPLSRELVDARGPWFQSFHLDGIQTTPGHPLGIYPDAYFRRFAHALPTDPTGWPMLDIEPLYLRQARQHAVRGRLVLHALPRSVAGR